jgi:hypothetical protein
MNVLILLVVFGFLSILGPEVDVLHAQQADTEVKKTVGWLEKVYLPNYQFALRGKMDTGAKNSSLHATDMQFVPVEGKSPQSRVRFTTIDTKGNDRTIEADVIRQVRIKKATLGSETPLVETRVEVELLLCLAGVSKPIRVNLTNREGMNYHLILGRTALENDFMVDVSHTFIGGKECRNIKSNEEPIRENIQ